MDKKILLPDDDVQVFKVYQTWLNTGSLRYIFDHEKEEWWLHLAKLWIFTDKIRSPRLRNRVTDAFFDIVARNGSNVDKNFAYAQAGTVDYVYSNTYRGSPLRMIFVELYLYLSPSNTSMRRYHPEFLATTLKEAMTNKGPPRNKLPRSALYHMDCEDSCCKKLCS